MKKVFRDVLRLLRPRQWIKNLAVFAAIIFTGHLFDTPVLLKVITAFFVFCFSSSAIYIVNDFFDIKKDKLHPFKRFRPLAHGDISVRTAMIMATALTTLSLLLAFTLPAAFITVVIIYLLLQLCYSLFLKYITVLDILTIAAGYILRVYAGEFASGYHISVWLSLTTISISLFLAIGKRRSELTLISNHSGGHVAQIRETLSHYSERLLDVYASMFVTCTFISYALFTFFENPTGVKLSFNNLLLPEFLPAFFQKKWLMITILPVVYGLMRYLQDIYEKHEGESPEKVLLSDNQLLTSVILWIFLVIVIIYFIG